MARANQIASAFGAISNSRKTGKDSAIRENPNGSARVSFESLAPMRRDWNESKVNRRSRS